MYPLLFQMTLPKYRSFDGIQAKDVSPLADCEDFVVVNRRCGPRTAFVILRVECRIITMLPDRFASPCVQAPDRVLFVSVPHRIDPPLADGNGRETGSY